MSLFALEPCEGLRRTFNMEQNLLPIRSKSYGFLKLTYSEQLTLIEMIAERDKIKTGTDRARLANT